MAGIVDTDVVEALRGADAPEQDRLLVERSAEVAELMANGFAEAQPELAAKSGFARWQLRAVAVAALGGLSAVVAAPMAALVVFTALSTAYSLLHAVIAAAGMRRVGSTADRPLTDEELPSYTVLVPAYQEASVIGELIRQLGELDYPADQLEVLVLLERHDPDTLRAVRAADPPPFVRLVHLPPGPPQTKPRAVNLGLMLARGELLVVFDAEDRPEPDQLRRVAARFAARDERLACVQAQLLFRNAEVNWLTRQSALEYALRFKFALHGMVRLGMPIPLGGTSNHFRTATLRQLGGWDAWNVTEDADLGMRCAALGKRVEMIDAVTWEEAVGRPGPWVRQRTRWFKGFLMTAVVHTRHPHRTVRRFRLSGLLSLLGVVASAPLTSALQPVASVLTLLALANDPGPVLPVLAAQALSVASWIGITYASARRAGLTAPRYAVFAPVYSMLWSVAAWRALHQLAVSPFSWEKTPHGADAARHEHAPR